MKSCCLIILIFYLIPCQAQQGSGPFLSLSERSYDFGRIIEDKGFVRHRFIFSNTGSGPFVVSNVRSTCECTRLQWSREPVMPGSQGFIEIAFNPEGQAGSFYKTIQVVSTAKNSYLLLSISGVVAPAARDENLPHRIGGLDIKTKRVNFGYIYKGEIRTENIPVANKTHGPVSLSFADVPQYLTIGAIPEVLDPGESGYLEVKLSSEVTDDWDVLIHHVKVLVSGEDRGDAVLTVTANIREDFRELTDSQMLVSPVAVYDKDTMNLGRIASDQPQVCRFRLSNDGGENLIIRSVKTSCGCTAAIPEKRVLAPGEYAYIDAVYDPKGNTGRFHHSITVITNDPRLYKKHLFIVGTVNH